MRVAMPNWQGRISPVLDVAENILITEISGEPLNLRQELTLCEKDPFERARLLKAFGTEILICCTLSRQHQVALVSAGIRVIPHICGRVEDVIEAISNGQFSDSFLMPGCKDLSQGGDLNVCLRNGHRREPGRRLNRRRRGNCG